MSVRGDLNRLQQASTVAGENQDAVILGHHGVPVACLGEGGGCGAVGQGDDIGKRCRGLIVADDNQCGDEYDARDHCCGQDRDQPPQETHVGRFGDLIFGGVVHV